MQYAIARNGQHLGSFPESEARAGLAHGRFSFSDLAWTQGMTEWRYLGELLNVGTPLGFPPPPSMEDSAGMRMLLPVGRSGWAIAAGYLGLCSLAVFPAPIALIFSLVAVYDIRKSNASGQSKKYGMGRAIFGLIAGLIGTLLLVYLIARGLL